MFCVCLLCVIFFYSWFVFILSVLCFLVFLLLNSCLIVCFACMDGVLLHPLC